MVRSLAAQRFAERVHAGEPDRYGVPLLDHVRRVAAAVPPDARTVAWLHEVLECTTVAADELAGIGVSADELDCRPAPGAHADRGRDGVPGAHRTDRRRPGPRR